ncbi:MFS transporter [Candidatus Magnetomonas plexicatena]|uniref:MFS transporter n=1 Tax=Candidatus Magnetomonas plexicatena TaxID=2552947 RepID=UPI0011007EC4|nr:MFS transporter [Nitrospirales bacterium LBB_01]
MISETKHRFSALYVKEFRHYFLAQAISLSGTWIHQTAAGWLMYSLTKSALYLGLLGMSLSLPILLFTLIGGVLADRFKKRELLILTQALSIIPAAILALLLAFNMIKVWEIIAVSFFLGTINSIDTPVRQSFLIEIAGKNNILNAVALTSTIFHAARAVGPIIAGFAINHFGFSICFTLNAVTFLPVVYVLIQMKITCDNKKSAPQSLFKEFSEGLTYVIKSRRIAFIMVTITVFSLFCIPYSHFLPLFIDKVFHSNVVGLGYLMSATGVGSLFAGFIIAYNRDIKNKRKFMSITGFLLPFSLFTFCFVKNFTAAMFLLALTGFNLVSFLATANSYIQLKVSDSIRGRVMSVYTLMFLGMAPLGAALIGSLAQLWSIEKTIAVTTSISLSGFLIFRRKWA